MRILLSAYGCDPLKGGEGQAGWYCAVALAHRGHEVCCLTNRWGQANIEAQPTVPGLQFAYADVPQWVEKSYVNDLGVYLHYLYWQQSALQAARQLDATHQFEVVHHISYGSLQLGTPMWRLRKPLVFGPVGGGQFPVATFSTYFQQHWHKERLRFHISRMLGLFNPHVRQMLPRASLVLATNRETLEMARRLGARRSELFLDAGLPDTFFPEVIPVRPPGTVLKLLWVGRLLPRKGLLVVLQALARIRDTTPFCLTIIGDGPLGPQVPIWLAEYGLTQHVSWLGRKPWSELRVAFEAHDAFIFCSLRDSFGAQLLEAMAFGLPIVTLNLFGARDLLPPEVGIRVRADQPEETLQEIGAAVTYLQQHPQARQEMGKAAACFAQQHGWSVRAARFEAFYAQLLSGWRENFSLQ